MDEDIRNVFSKGEALSDEAAIVVNTIRQMIKEFPPWNWKDFEENKRWWLKLETVLGLSRYVYDFEEDGIGGYCDLYEYHYEKNGIFDHLLQLLPSCSTDDFIFLLLPNEYVIMFSGLNGTLLVYTAEEAYWDYRLYLFSGK